MCASSEDTLGTTVQWYIQEQGNITNCGITGIADCSQQVSYDPSTYERVWETCEERNILLSQCHNELIFLISGVIKSDVVYASLCYWVGLMQ